MEIFELIQKRRTIRKFSQKPISKEALVRMLEAARSAPSGANMQPIKYVAVKEESLCNEIFPLTKWAAYLAPCGTPNPGETPVAYIAVLVDTSIRKNGDNDASLASANIILTAFSEGIGSCILGSIDREKLKELLKIPEHHDIHTLIALGYPAQESRMENEDGSIKYYMDEEGIIHVPKRKLEDISRFID